MCGHEQSPSEPQGTCPISQPMCTECQPSGLDALREAGGRQGPPGAQEGLGEEPDRGPPACPRNQGVQPRQPERTSHSSLPGSRRPVGLGAGCRFPRGIGEPVLGSVASLRGMITCFSKGDAELRALTAAGHRSSPRWVRGSTGVRLSAEPVPPTPTSQAVSTDVTPAWTERQDTPASPGGMSSSRPGAGSPSSPVPRQSSLESCSGC